MIEKIQPVSPVPFRPDKDPRQKPEQLPPQQKPSEEPKQPMPQEEPREGEPVHKIDKTV